MGLSHVVQRGEFDVVIVMDSDGENARGETVRLINAQKEHSSAVLGRCSREAVGGS